MPPAPEKYVSVLEVHIRSMRIKVARDIAEEALQIYPQDLLIASYCGLLGVLSGAGKKAGIQTCLSAVEGAKKANSDKSVKGALYLNLGRAYLGGRMKKEAIETFREGLRIDRKNKALHWELRKAGIRRKPVLPFLSRTNFINRGLGILLYGYLGLKGKSKDAEDAK